MHSHPRGSYAPFRRKSTLNSFPATTYGMQFAGKTGTVDRCHGYGEDDPIVMEKSDRRSDTRPHYLNLILIVYKYYNSINKFDERSISNFFDLLEYPGFLEKKGTARDSASSREN